ncbi:hypothetical protein [Algicola sagamiensis]|uniref:hypothetical protein n=1 Tax=Algicola sagamiensis TaxID=163869 RepID=UPI001B7FA064|nr:hypothetical protein [Algicola sagamiensis]
MKEISMRTEKVYRRCHALLKARESAHQELKTIKASAARIENILTTQGTDLCPQLEMAQFQHLTSLQKRIDSELWRSIFHEMNLLRVLAPAHLQQLNQWMDDEVVPDFNKTRLNQIFATFTSIPEKQLRCLAIQQVFTLFLDWDGDENANVEKVPERIELKDPFFELNGAIKLKLHVRTLLDDLDRLLREIYQLERSKLSDRLDAFFQEDFQIQLKEIGMTIESKKLKSLAISFDRETQILLEKAIKDAPEYMELNIEKLIRDIGFISQSELICLSSTSDEKEIKYQAPLSEAI